MNTTNKQELISALADGELRGDEVAQAVGHATADAAARAEWEAICVIGEVLRTGTVAGGTRPDLFLSKLQERLAVEPVPARPVAVPVPVAPAANDAWWKVVAGVASFAAVVAVAWNVSRPDVQPQLAAAPGANPSLVQAVATQPAAVQPTAMIRDPRLDQFLAAHRQFAGGTALQTSSGFLRNATFEPSGR